MRQAPSIERRLAWRLGVLLIAASVLSLVALFFRYRSGHSELPEEYLSDSAHIIIKAIAVAPDGALSVKLAGDQIARYADPHGPSYLVRGENGQVLAASSAAAAERIGQPPHEWSRIYYRIAPSANDPARIAASLHTRLDGRELVIQVSEPDRTVSTEVRNVFEELFDDVLLPFLPFVAGTLVLVVFTIRRSLAPIARVAHEAARINPHATDIRLTEREVPSELLGLVRAVNSALDRLDQGFRIQRDFTADAAHELRTPLAILAAHLDVLPDRLAAEALREDVERMARLINQLLRVAELEDLTIRPDETADLHAIAVDTAASLAPIALMRQRSIEVTGEAGPVRVRGNADALAQAVRNLAENALEHTRPGTAVRLQVTDEPAIEVSDQGPGIPEEQRPHVFERFWRARRGDGRGSGLGLAIVARIARAHRGTVTLDAAPGGGARFTLHLLAPG